MARQLYIILLTLHPAQFRYRFAFEMLGIFDEAATHGSTLPLLADGVLSLVRQWMRPYHPVAAAALSDGAGTPVFCLLDAAPPKRRCLVAGAIFSVVVFTALATSNGRDEWSARILAAAFHSRPNILRLHSAPGEPFR